MPTVIKPVESATQPAKEYLPIFEEVKKDVPLPADDLNWAMSTYGKVPAKYQTTSPVGENAKEQAMFMVDLITTAMQEPTKKEAAA